MIALNPLSSLFDERRAREAVEECLPTLVRSLEALDGPERAATMIVAHAIWRDAADEYGQGFIERPSRIPKRDVVSFLARLARAKRRLVLSVESVVDLKASDPMYLGTMRQLRATEVMLTTLGSAVVPAAPKTAVRCWQVLWEGRRHAVSAVRLLRSFEIATKTAALPSSQSGRPDDMAQLATRLPPALRRKPGGTSQ